MPVRADAKIELIVTIAVVAAAVIGVIVGCSCKPSSVSSDDTPYTDLAQPLLRDEPDAEAPPAAEGSDDGWGRASPEPIHDDTVEVIPLEGGVTLTPTRAPAPGVSDLNTSINN